MNADSCQVIAVCLRTAYFDIHRNAVTAAEAFVLLVVVSGYVDPDWVRFADVFLLLCFIFYILCSPSCQA